MRGVRQRRVSGEGEREDMGGRGKEERVKKRSEREGGNVRESESESKSE